MFASNNKTSLNQGKQFRTMQKMFNKVIKNIGKSNYIGMEGLDHDEESKMDTLTKSFRNTLVEYEEAFRLHLSGALVDENNIFQYYGKTIKSGDKLYWITNKGVKRELMVPEDDTYSIHTPEGRNKIAVAHGCKLPDTTDIDSTTLNLFELGQPLKFKQNTSLENAATGERYIWQKCNSQWEIGGHFIKREGSEELGWYDWKGKKHLFKTGLLKENIHNSCPKRDSNKPTYEVKENEWNLMTNGGTLNENSPCPGPIKDNKSTILILNNNLIDLAKEMKYEIDSINNRNQDTKESSTDANMAVTMLISELTQHRKQVTELQKEIFSLDTSITDNKHLVKAINLRYVTWGISLITISLLIMHQINK